MLSSKRKVRCWTWGCTPVTLTPWRSRQENSKFWVTLPPPKKRKKKRNEKQNKNMSCDLDVTVRTNRACSTHRQQTCAWQALSQFATSTASSNACPAQDLGFPVLQGNTPGRAFYKERGCREELGICWTLVGVSWWWFTVEDAVYERKGGEGKRFRVPEHPLAFILQSPVYTYSHILRSRR